MTRARPGDGVGGGPAEVAAHVEDHHRESSPYLELERATWAALAHETPNPLSAEEIRRLRGLGDALDLTEVQEVYLPLSRLLSLYVGSNGSLHRQQEAFLHRRTPPRVSRSQGSCRGSPRAHWMSVPATPAGSAAGRYACPAKAPMWPPERTTSPLASTPIGPRPGRAVRAAFTAATYCGK